ncbi:MAG: hypothetical protein GWN07_03150, partial [Actinobacteria bacterium]|nr:hypothetical protein [Actinomycetota bacterium]NIS29110.1 hypothetical protein [Actinomycetota bacterium]NIT94351.1 hypothetical protein [Actinomycetota bacterium]NIU64516.1 hypothetical protein [Actinomycetota bacterium]NIW26308.1 hypothetical protein [Actinomycetota bacterium]
MAVLAILQPDARTAARLTAALGHAHHVFELSSWEALGRLLAERDVHGCIVDPGQRDWFAANVAGLRRRHPGLAIVVCVGSEPPDGYFDLGGLGVDGLLDASKPKRTLRADVDQALSDARGGQILRALEGRLPSPASEALAWAVAHAARDTTVQRMAGALGQTPRSLRDALNAAGMPSPARILLWGRLLLAG